MKPSIIESVVSRHAEEAAFLWLLRDRAVGQPHSLLAQVAALDDRLEAHLDGLRVAGDPGWGLCRAGLEEGDAGEVFAAALLAFESGKDDRVQEVLKFGTKSPKVSRGLVSALGWIPYEEAEKHIQRLHGTDSPILRRIGIAASVIHRRSPGRALDQALSHADPFLKSRALRAIGELGVLDWLPTARKNLTYEDERCRFEAAWSVALRGGDANAVATLKTFAESSSPFRHRALQLALRRMELAVANAWRVKLARDPGQLRSAVIAAGVIGDPSAVAWLIEQMKVPLQARVAAEAFTMITGVDITQAPFAGEKPEGFEAGPTDNPEDENVQMDPDENLPWPNPGAVGQWWKDHQGEFSRGSRYLLGKAINVESLQEILRTGRQRQRAAAAIELAIKQRSQSLFEVRAPGLRQKKLLGLTG
jgi:uncharacterized protein (TIGR02270 family)